MARSPARLLLVLVLATSCVLLVQLAEGRFEKPDSGLQERGAVGRLAERGDAERRDAGVDNPNPVGLSLADVDYRLSIDGHPVAAGKPPEGLEIPANGNADVTLPASFQFADLGQAVATVLSKGSAGYKAEGTVGLKTPVGVVRVPLSHEGTFTLPVDAGHHAWERHGSTSVALDHADGGVPGHADREGELPVPLQALEAAVTIGGARVGEVSAKDLGTLAPGTSRSVSLPVTIPFSGALEAAQAIMKGGTVPIALDGQLQSGPAPVPFSVTTTAQFRR